MNLSLFLSGIYMATFAASGIFFMKFYRATGDRFFRFFAYACGLFALERIALFFVADAFNPNPSATDETRSLVYLFRLVAFLFILYAIIDKNRKTRVNKS